MICDSPLWQTLEADTFVMWYLILIGVERTVIFYFMYLKQCLRVFMWKLARGMQCIYQQQNKNYKIIKVFTSKPLENERTINNKNKFLAFLNPRRSLLHLAKGVFSLCPQLSCRLLVLDLLRRLVVGLVLGWICEGTRKVFLNPIPRVFRCSEGEIVSVARKEVASRRRFELLACPLGGGRSIQLSYRDAGWVVYQQRETRLVFLSLQITDCVIYSD